MNYTPIITDAAYNEMSYNLISKIKIKKDTWYPDIIIGITRGGLPLAVKLSHYLHVPMCTWKVKTREGVDVDPFPLDNSYLNKNILIVEDINDLSQTFFTIEDEIKRTAFSLEKIKYAALINNICSLFKKLHYYGQEIIKTENDPFIIFPWEEQ